MEVAKGTQVTYITSKGPQINLVPDVTGQSKSSATAALKKAGFKNVSVSSDFSDTVDAGDVISQSPSGGSSYPPKTPVTITVSLGKGITVPNVSGQDWASAKALLEAVNLKISPGVDTSGTVQSQSPVANKTVKTGTTVKVTLGL